MKTNRDKNVDIFYETWNYAKKDKEDLEYSIGKQYVTNPSILKGTPLGENTKVIVNQMKTFDAARIYAKQGKTAALNFASATTPGGGVLRGASAQEECLCRVSNLYPCLNDKKMYAEFYMPNQSEHNALHNNKIIYTPHVKIYKNDDYEWLDEPEYVDVITCAAPNLREHTSNQYNPGDGPSVKVSDEELRNIHYWRLAGILTAAINEGVENIILGAFGCGAFRNPPEVVAEAMKTAIQHYGGAFKNIVFAVYCGDPEKTNYKVFAETMKPLM